MEPEGASSWTPPHCLSHTACALGLPNTSPTHPPSTPQGPTVVRCVPSHLTSHPSLLFPLVTVPMAAGKTFVNVTVAPETLNPPPAPQVKFWLCIPGIEFVCSPAADALRLPLPHLQFLLFLRFECVF